MRATIVTCDKCGGETSVNEIHSTMWFAENGVNTTFDLCPNCWWKFKKDYLRKSAAS